MKSAFISYRRKDTVDIAGRIFDRLGGYFGPGSVLLDVDALVSGANYRTQIERLLERCSVVMAIIGQEWLDARDEAGQRRLDNPDDQLRIEIAVALKSGRTVIPVIVHEARMPQASELPDELQPLASCDPHVVSSGTAFNTDVQLLVERLEQCGLDPPETRFPLQMVLMPLGIAVVLAGLFGVLMPPTDLDDDFVLQQLDPAAPLDELRTVYDGEKWDGRKFDLARYDRNLFKRLAWVLFPLAAGPMLIVWGKRQCCLSKERTAAQRHYAQGAGRLPIPKSRKSVWCLALGLGSIGAGPLTALPAFAVGASAWRELRRPPTWIRGRSLVVVGAIASGLGIAASLFIHVPAWRLRTWLAVMERAAVAQRGGDLEAAVRETGRALRLSGANSLAPATTLVRRADYLMQLRGPEAAAAELTKAISNIDTLAAGQGSYTSLQYAGAIGERAHDLRAEAYEQLGQPEKAELDRQWYPGLLNSDAPVAPSPDESDEAPPAPPAPAADPAARLEPRHENPRLTEVRRLRLRRIEPWDASG